MKKIICVFMIVCITLLCLVSCNRAVYQQTQGESEQQTRYNEAFTFIDKGDYTAAYEIFNELGNYKDSQEQLSRFQYVPLKRVITCDHLTIIGEIILNDLNLPIQIEDRPVSIVEQTDKRIFEFTYDEVGKLTQKVVTIKDIPTVYDYTYNEENRLIQEICTFSDGRVNQSHYSYDGQGNLIKKMDSYSDGSVRIREYQYDSYGKITEESEKYTSNDFIYETKYTRIYDTVGNLIKETQTHSDGKTSGFDFVYDSNGHLLKRIHTTYSGAQYTYECVYDVNGNLTKEIYIDSDGKKEFYDMAYDAEGNLVEGGYTEQGTDREVYRRAYYDEGKLIKDVYADYVHEYTYDENGNLIKENISRAQQTDILVEYEYKLVYVKFDVPQEIEQRVNDFCYHWSSFEEWFSNDKESGNGEKG